MGSIDCLPNPFFRAPLFQMVRPRSKKKQWCNLNVRTQTVSEMVACNSRRETGQLYLLAILYKVESEIYTVVGAILIILSVPENEPRLDRGFYLRFFSYPKPRFF